MPFDYKKFLSASKPIAFKVMDVATHEKRPNYLKVTGVLEDGSESFFVASEEELSKLPCDDSGSILNLTGFAVIKKNKINKSYVERINPLPPLGGGSGFVNPFAK